MGRSTITTQYSLQMFQERASLINALQCSLCNITSSKGELRRCDFWLRAPLFQARLLRGSLQRGACALAVSVQADIAISLRWRSPHPRLCMSPAFLSTSLVGNLTLYALIVYLPQTDLRLCTANLKMRVSTACQACR